MVTWCITDNAKESLDADTYVKALQLTDFKGIRGNLMDGGDVAVPNGGSCEVLL